MGDDWDEVDLYGDLNELKSSSGASIEELQARINYLTAENKELQLAVKMVTEERDRLEAKYRTLLMNTSSLFKTAKAEVERKVNLIADLRGKIQAAPRARRRRSPSPRKSLTVRNPSEPAAIIESRITPKLYQPTTACKVDRPMELAKERQTPAEDQVQTVESPKVIEPRTNQSQLNACKRTERQVDTIYSKRMRIRLGESTKGSEDVKSVADEVKECVADPSSRLNGQSDGLRPSEGQKTPNPPPSIKVIPPKSCENKENIEATDVPSTSPTIIISRHRQIKLSASELPPPITIKPKDDLKTPVNTTSSRNKERHVKMDDLLEKLFGSPLKWTDSSLDEIPKLDVSSPTVYEDSCSAQIENSQFGGKRPTKLQEVLTEKRSFEEVGSAKSISPFFPHNSRSISSIKNYLTNEDTLFGQCESTTQFISSLTRVESKVSPLNTPVKPPPDPPDTSSKFTEHQFKSDKPVNVLQPRKTPRIVTSCSPTKKTKLFNLEASFLTKQKNRWSQTKADKTVKTFKPSSALRKKPLVVPATPSPAQPTNKPLGKIIPARRRTIAFNGFTQLNCGKVITSGSRPVNFGVG